VPRGVVDGAGVRYTWHGGPRAEHEGAGAVCLQAQLLVSCEDRAGRGGANFSDPAGRNCSEYLRQVMACPVSTGGGTRRVQLVRGEGRGVSS
jgi:hypothetical protein